MMAADGDIPIGVAPREIALHMRYAHYTFYSFSFCVQMFNIEKKKALTSA